MELTTARLSLAPLDPDRDADALHVAYRDPDVMRWWDSPLRVDVAETRQDLAALLHGEGAHIWAVREAGTTVGLVGLLGGVAVPGLMWMLARKAWGRGLMTEAATTLIDYAFENLGLTRVEAWVESTNVRSLATAHRIGLTGHGSLAQRYPHRGHPHESIVLGRSRHQEPTPVLAVEVTLPVHDVAAEFDMLRAVFNVRALYEVGDPPTMVGVVFGPWSVGPRLRLVGAPPPIAPITVGIDVGTGFDTTYDRAAAAGASVPVEQPWGMREFVLRLSDGHQLVVTGPF